MASDGKASQQSRRLAIIGGSSFLKSDVLAAFTPFVHHTAHGSVKLWRGKDGLSQVIFVQRHGADPIHPYTPPHLINKKAIALAVQQLGVTEVIAFGSTGSLQPDTVPVGSCVVPTDYTCIDAPATLADNSYDGHRVPTLRGPLRDKVVAVLKDAGFKRLILDAVYVQTIGPRFETEAEIRVLAKQADIVGMTAAHEADLFGELRIPYTLVCMVDNMANGLTAKPFQFEDFHKGVHDNLHTVEDVLRTLLKAFAPVPPKLPTGRELRVVDLLVAAPYVLPMTPAPAHAGAPHPVHMDLDGDVKAHTPAPENGLESKAVPPTASHHSAHVLQHHAVIVHEGVIVDVLPYADALDLYAPVSVELLQDHVLMPGLINGHSHAAMSLFRGFADDLGLIEWLTQHIWPAEAKFVTPEFVRDGVRLAIAEMIRGGITCFSDMYFFPEECAKVVDETGIRAAIGMVLLDFPTQYAKNTDEYIAKGRALHKAFHQHPRISIMVSPHSPYAVCDENWARVSALSKELDVRIHTHVHETAEEVEDSIKGNKASMACHRSEQRCAPLDNLHRMGVVHGSLVAAHMTQLTDAQIALMAKTKAHVIHCPTSNLKLAAGFCQTAKLLKEGVNVALGTDSCASNNSLDLMSEVKLAAILAKAVAKDPRVVPAIQALQMATINGARALGIDSITGSLAKGKAADIVALRLGDIESLPLYDLAAHVVYSASREQVTDVWVHGKRLLKARQLLTIDEAQLKQTTRAWNAKLIKLATEDEAVPVA